MSVEGRRLDIVRPGKADGVRGTTESGSRKRGRNVGSRDGMVEPQAGQSGRRTIVDPETIQAARLRVPVGERDADRPLPGAAIA